MFYEGRDYEWVSGFDKYVGKYIPVYYWRQARLLRYYYYKIGDTEFHIEAGTTWNGPSLGIAFECLMEASLRHDIAYRYHDHCPGLKREDVDLDYVNAVLRDGASTWYAEQIFSTPVQRMFQFAWDRNMG